VGDWYATTAPENKYQYNGKELNEELGLNWNDYGARYYDPAIARWNAVDPLAEKFYPWSTYNYTYNNPLIYTDPDGRGPIKRFLKKVVKNTIKRRGKIDLKADSIDTFNDYADAIKTFGDGVWGIDDVITAFELVTDIEMSDLKGLRKGLNQLADKFGLAKRTGKKGIDPDHHNANVRITDADGKTVRANREVSGNMTEEEKALGYPKNTLATHTEARAVGNQDNIDLLNKGNNMTITGQKAPCPSCKGKMNKAAKKTGATIQYQWREKGKTKIWRAKN